MSGISTVLSVILVVTALALGGCGRDTSTDEPAATPRASDARRKVHQIDDPGNAAQVAALETAGAKLVRDAQGSVVELRLSAAGKTDAVATLSQMASLKRLALEGPDWGDPQVERLGQLTGLEVLSLENTRTTDAGLAALKDLRNLRSLNVRRTQITAEGLATVAKLPKLAELDLRFNSTIDDGAMDTIAAMTALRSLKLQQTRVSDNGVAKLASLSGLQTLNLVGRQFTSRGLESLKGLKLKVLEMDDAQLDDTGLEYLKDMVSLERLHLRRTFISNEGLAKLAALKNLKTLMIRDTLVDNDGAVYLAQFPELEVLDLHENLIGDAAAEHIRKLDKLEELGLKATKMTSAGLRQLTGMPSLKSLLLAGCPAVDDSAGDALLSFPKIELLDLQGTAITDAFVDRLITRLPQLTHLQRVQLTNTSVSAAAVERLRKAGGKLAVDY